MVIFDQSLDADAFYKKQQHELYKKRLYYSMLFNRNYPVVAGTGGTGEDFEILMQHLYDTYKRENQFNEIYLAPMIYDDAIINPL